jgi:hypothetical protein
VGRDSLFSKRLDLAIRDICTFGTAVGCCIVVPLGLSAGR